MEKNRDKNIHVKTVAESLQVSREYLTRVFQREMDCTLHDYILRQKMQYACDLLRETELSHGEISVALGYGSLAHFSRVFKSVLRMTPREFRRAGIIADL